MIVKNLANTFYRSGRKAVRELSNRCLNAEYIGVRLVGHQPAQAFLVSGLEFFHFGQVRVKHGHDHENGIVVKLREKYPNAAITICADNDHQHTRRTPEGTELWNKGVALAQDAAKAVGGKVVTPIFNEEERVRGVTDFNDLHQSRGLDEVKRQVGLALQKDKEQEKSREKGKTRGLSL